MSVSIIDRQASLYPISLFQPLPNDAASRYNIGAITDASIVLQVSRDTLDSVSSIVVYIQVISKDRIDVYCSLTATSGELQLLSYTLLYDAVELLYTDGRSRVYTQPGSELLPSDLRLRINASCIHIYTIPAILSLRHSPLQRRAASSLVTPEYLELLMLLFEALGYNTLISMQQDTITITGSPGIGLGVHPVNATIYGPDVISSSLLALLLNKTPGLTSINGYTGAVTIYGGASISLHTLCDGLTITLRIVPKDLDTDEQNS